MSDLTCTTHKLLHATNLGVQKGDQQVANGKLQACLILMSIAELYIVVHYQMHCHYNSLSQHNVIFAKQCQRLLAGRHLPSVNNTVDHTVCDNQQEVQNAMAT